MNGKTVISSCKAPGTFKEYNSSILKLFHHRGSKYFSYNVRNPSAYGVIEQNKKKIKIIEKPKKTNSKKVITGLYFFDKNVSKLSSKLKNLKEEN